MHTYRKLLVCLLIVCTLLLAWGEPAALGQSSLPEKPAPGTLEGKARTLTIELNKQGFEVLQGYFRLYSQEDCPYSYAVMKTCYGNNPAAPYVIYDLPHWPEEFVDPATQFAFGPTQAGYSTSFRFDPREAIVILGVLPPPAAYFGLQSYLFTRQGAFDTQSVSYQFIANFFPNMLDMFFTGVPNNPQRVQIFGSLSNSINNVVIQRQSGAAFNQPRAFIITPDEFVDNKVRIALNKLSIEDKNIFTEPIPSNLTIGLDAASDDFVTLIRYAMPEDGGGAGTPSDTWRNNLPLIVLRVRDTRHGRPAKPYPPVNLETRTAADELYLKSDLISLVSAVSQKWGQPCADAECADRAVASFRVQLPPINVVGPNCTEINMNCGGDSQDAVYQLFKTLTLDENVVYAVAGTLGVRTGNATYVGLGLNGTMKKFGFHNISDKDLQGTASAYASQVNNTDKFFLYYFTRDCSGLQELTGGYCYEISETELPLCNDPTSKTCDNLGFSIRDYIRPGTQRGPAAILKLPAMQITLQKP